MTQTQFLLQPLSAAVLIALSSSGVFAEDDIQTKKMAPIVVTAQDNRLSNGLIVQADPKQPIQPVPATDGADYLQSIMGFNAIKNGGTNGDVTFRGMFGSRIKILTDGTENLGACPARMDAPTSYINPESYDRITVIKGPQTVQYANTGSAATVIFDREPENLTANQPYRGQASVLMGSYGRLDHNVEAAIGDETKYARINANRSVANDYQDGNGDKVHSNWERWNADLAIGWKPTQDSWIELKGGKGDGEAAYAGRTMDGTQFQRKSLGLHAEQKNLTDVIKKVEAQVDYSYNDHIMDNYKMRTPPMMPMAMEVTRRTLNTRAAITTEWDNFSVISGVDRQENKHAGNMYMRDANPIPPLDGDLRFESYGAFSEWTYRLNPNNKLVAGARFDHVKVDSAENDQERTDTNPSGFIRIESNLPEHGFKTYAGIGYVERSPDYWELYSTATDHGNGSTNMMGQSSYLMVNNLNNLKTEKTAQLDIGFEQQHGAWNTWASAYAGLINDFILVRYNAPNASQMYPLANNVDATIAGAEAGVGYQFNEHLQADLSAMYAWGENTTDNKPLPQIAPLEGRLNLRYVQEKYSLGLLWRAVAEQNRISLNDGNIVGYDMGKSKAFSTLAMNATYKYSEALDFSVGIDNLLDKAYSEHLNKSGAALFSYAANEQFNNIGRNYWARVSMKF
ncbi:MAG TPA: TonB-dependent copper receptor [Acinetobacter ursingii]|uniref:TonB-dependent copper receptor n=1 Tax=Acinetobacter ursingii TaxID=108980 RepID=A0A3D2SRZ1_9GAMM|nr:TonB-dependent copper receptor [Acinetobacter ursingii]MCH2005235.1 TonB-dependent copper receptor [Acinetobacter ursingii]MCU4306752.1 TonB-dependent copper receptor [Acinetobacter ursingii]MCU4372778.1 TonB-dependent copper receptor [Acinetobacter ursingii]MCU4382333.1 TonB-dependent copper receptor [Acinetobacter ursingii]MCU4610530.1 TonB-dependent copper receptor [Acinetobacter ursingii]